MVDRDRKERVEEELEEKERMVGEKDLGSKNEDGSEKKTKKQKIETPQKSRHILVSHYYFSESL